MLTTLSIGILSSLATEAVNWLNVKLTNTVLHGKGAFTLALFVSFIGASFQVVHSGASLFDLQTLGTTFAQVWTVTQVFFIFVVQNLKLDVQPEKE